MSDLVPPAGRPGRHRPNLVGSHPDEDVRWRLAQHEGDGRFRESLRGDPIPALASPPRGARRQTGRVHEPTPERSIHRASMLGVVRELVEQRRLEIARGAGGSNEHQRRAGLVARSIVERPRHPDRHGTQTVRAPGEARGESTPRLRGDPPEVAGCPIGEAKGGPAGVGGGQHRGRGNGRHHQPDDARTSHVPNGTAGTPRGR
jgi:hypothetical protein